MQNGNVGVAGVANAEATMDLGAGTGKPKLYLYNDSASVLGFGIYANELRSFTDLAATRFSWGYQSHAGAFNEWMRLDGGRLGIGAPPITLSFLQVRVGTNQNLGVRPPTNIPGAVQLDVYNDAANANIPMEFVGTMFGFFGGQVGLGVAADYGARLTIDAGVRPIFLRNPGTGNGFAIRNDTAVFKIGYEGDNGSDVGSHIAMDWTGALSIPLGTTPTDGFLINGNGCFYLDEVGKNVMVKIKTSGAVVKTVVLGTWT
jgi:hypothetical protein